MGLFKSITDGLGLTRPDPHLVDIPNTIRPRDVVNEILGAESVEEEFTRPDGTKGLRLVTRSVLTPEDEERLRILDESYDNYVGDLTQLTEIEAAINSPVFEPVVTAVREQQSEARTNAFKERARLEEETLSKRGLADSTSATEVRDQRGTDLVDKATSDERDLVLLAEQLRTEQLGRTGIGLQFSSGARQQDLQNRAMGGQAAQASQLSLFGAENNLQNARTSFQFENMKKLTEADSIQRTNIGDTISTISSGLTFGATGGLSGFDFGKMMTGTAKG